MHVKAISALQAVWRVLDGARLLAMRLIQQYSLHSAPYMQLMLTGHEDGFCPSLHHWELIFVATNQKSMSTKFTFRVRWITFLH